MAFGIPDNPNPAPNYMETVVFANPLNLDADDSNAFYSLITGDTTLNLLNTRIGATYLIQLDMDGTGGHTITLGSLFRGVLTGTYSIDTVADAVNLITIFVAKAGYIIYSINNTTISETTTTTTT